MRSSLFLLSVLLNVMFIACASSPTPVQTWLIGPNGIEHRTPTEDEVLTLAQAVGMRCYTRADDEVWRERMALCCGEAGL